MSRSRGDLVPAPCVGVAHTADEAFEAVFDCLGVAIVAEGNTAIYQRDGIVMVPVTGPPSSKLTLARRAQVRNPAVRDFVDAAMEQPEHRHLTGA